MRAGQIAALAAAVLMLCVSHVAHARDPVALSDIEIEALAIQVDDSEDTFTVVDSRMDETATAAVFFGLVGATVNSAVNNSEDEAKAQPYQETAAAIDLGGLVREAITARLSSRNTITLADAPGSASNTLVVEIGEWGLVRRAQRPDLAMRAFLKLNISVTDARGRTLWGPQREHAVGQVNVELAAFTPEMLRTEIEALATRSGQQIANRLIYR